jgi:hypothetical protein
VQTPNEEDYKKIRVAARLVRLLSREAGYRLKITLFVDARRFHPRPHEHVIATFDDMPSGDETGPSAMFFDTIYRAMLYTADNDTLTCDFDNRKFHPKPNLRATVEMGEITF